MRLFQSKTVWNSLSDDLCDLALFTVLVYSLLEISQFMRYVNSRLTYLNRMTNKHILNKPHVSRHGTH